LNHGDILSDGKDKCNNIAISLKEQSPGHLGHFPSSHEFLKQYYRRFLVQGLVIVAALGRLHAGWAAVSAGTCFHSF
jgi:hypothetical protein